MPAVRRREETPPITSVAVSGFKSFWQKQAIDVRPLTVLAGVNSSGKSSIIQPLLLLKQTLEAPYDPGPLLLDGPNVSVTRLEQILSLGPQRETQAKEFAIRFGVGDRSGLELRFGRAASGEVQLLDATYAEGSSSVTLSESMSQAQLDTAATGFAGDPFPNELDRRLSVDRDRWNLTFSSRIIGRGIQFQYISTDSYEQAIGGIIHLPALRGNPRRTYRTAAVEDTYPGVFNDYTAGTIAAWQNRGETDNLSQLRRDLELIGLTWDVKARQLDDTSVELLVARLPHGGDLVNIADMGFGVSQTLPVLVGLLAAQPGQFVYLEQPEIHLHPRAQVAFATLLPRSVERGARVVVETHSSLLLRGIQTLVARGELNPQDVALHWFSRNSETGETQIASASLDRTGAFGEWPEDFDEVNLRSDHDYLTAAESAQAREASGE